MKNFNNITLADSLEAIDSLCTSKAWFKHRLITLLQYLILIEDTFANLSNRESVRKLLKIAMTDNNTEEQQLAVLRLAYRIAYTTDKGVYSLLSGVNTSYVVTNAKFLVEHRIKQITEVIAGLSQSIDVEKNY